jgi:hypothetical protein
MDLDCGGVRAATGWVFSRPTGYDADLTRAVVEACVIACRAGTSPCEAVVS